MTWEFCMNASYNYNYIIPVIKYNNQHENNIQLYILALSHYYYNHLILIHICDVMGQNQSHVAKHQTELISILSEDVKICSFVFIKNEIFV